MIRKIKTEQLKPGMFVSDLNCGWLVHPFLLNQFHVKDQATINRIKQLGIRELYIDPEKGKDVFDAPMKHEADAQLDKDLHHHATEARRQIERDIVPIHVEMKVAKQLKTDATNIVKNVMQDVRLGKQVEVERSAHIVDEMVDSVFRNRSALTSLCRLKRKDEYTFFHSVSVCAQMISFCKSIGIEKEKIREVAIGAMLHDIGKMMIPDSILNKPDLLTDSEFTIMKRHPIEGRKILSRHEALTADQLSIATQHHERTDGSGYPDRLKGEGIHYFARIASIIDVYDAITSVRCYHAPMEPAVAIRKIFDWSKYHFDQQLVKEYIHCVGIYPVGSLVLLESGLLGIVKDVAKDNLLQPVVKVFYDTKKKRYIMPKVMDLSFPAYQDDRVASHQTLSAWNIKPSFLEETLMI